MFFPTIKFTANYSKEENNFFDLNTKLIDGELKEDFFVKSTGTHQSLDPPSCHTSLYKEGISYSQALRLNTIFSGDQSSDKRCNNFEKWLIERS